VKLNDRMKEISRIDREIDALAIGHTSNVITMVGRTAYRAEIRELQRQHAAHVNAIKSYSAPGGY
jgi:hypothetical protein